MTFRRRVNVDVNNHRFARQVGGSQAGFFENLSERGVGRAFAFINVASGLYPNPQTLMSVKDHSTDANDDGRRRDMNGPGFFGKRISKNVELGNKLLYRSAFSLIDR